FLNRDTLAAIPDRAARFVFVQLEIARVNAPARAATCARFHHDRPGRHSLDLTALSSQVCRRRMDSRRVLRGDYAVADSAKLISDENRRDRRLTSCADFIPR